MRYSVLPVLGVLGTLALVARPAAAQVAAATPTPAPSTPAPTAEPSPAPSHGISDTLPVYGEPSAQLASHTDDAGGFRSVEDAMAVLTRAQRDYQRAATFLAEHDTTALVGGSDALRARLAALDEVIPRVQKALYDAPQDPVLSQYYQASYEARETTLRQLGRSLPTGVRLTGY